MSEVQLEADSKKRSIGTLSIIIWIIVIGLLALLGWGIANNSSTRPLAGDPAPNFEIEFFEGHGWQENPESAQLAQMKGNVVVLNFWASWCVPCRAEAVELENTWQAYRDKNVLFLGVAYVDTEPKSLAFLEEFETTYPNGPDLQSNISDRFEVTAVPETFIIDADGIIQKVYIGPVTEAALTADLDQILSGQ